MLRLAQAPRRALGLPLTTLLLNYLIHGSGSWGRVFVVYSLGMDPKDPTLVRFHVLKYMCVCALCILSLFLDFYVSLETFFCIVNKPKYVLF